MKIVGFLAYNLTLRGTEVALYDYADFNEKILNNKSIIITKDFNKIKNNLDVSYDVYLKYKERFDIVEIFDNQDELDDIVMKHNITHLYIIKSGQFDGYGLMSRKCKNLIHCVFDCYQPHGDVYSVISEEVNKICNKNYSVVPHMIRVDDNNADMREELGIPKNAIVFGRYGGIDTFNFEFVHNTIKKILEHKKNIYFLFMNTYVFYTHPNIIYMKYTTSLYDKRRFINTCDALLHARTHGETFGLTCGEFAICNKPVITYPYSKDKAHIDILKDHAILYTSVEELYKILYEFDRNKYSMDNNGYMKYTPENVIKIFNEVYLS